MKSKSKSKSSTLAGAGLLSESEENEGWEEDEEEEGDGKIEMQDHTTSASRPSGRRGGRMEVDHEGAKEEDDEKEGEEENGRSKRKRRGGIEECVGNTPMIRIGSLSEETGCEVWAKVEVSLFTFSFLFFGIGLFVCLCFWFGSVTGFGFLWGGFSFFSLSPICCSFGLLSLFLAT